MCYEIYTTTVFDKWLSSVDDKRVKIRILARLDRIKQGHFGDAKPVCDSIYELRFFFGSGYRLYYTVKPDKIIILLCGGDKASQKKDIVKARQIRNELIRGNSL